jgi:hypothetical protein
MKVVQLTLFSTISFSALANASYLIGTGVGEIPALSDSFKPAVYLGYELTSSMKTFLYLQGKDSIERDGESFNADYGQQGLQVSSEETGIRAGLIVRYYPWNDYFYLTTGLIYNEADTEQQVFDTQSRMIGSNAYATDLQVTIKRPSGFGYGVGLGFEAPLTSNISLFADFTMDILSDPVEPDITIRANGLSQADSEALRKQISDNYQSNFHNRYHMFNLGMTFKF